MNSQEFCYWLQGFFELTDAQDLTPAQVDMIKRHLALVFVNVTRGTSETLPRPDLDETQEKKKGKKKGKKTESSVPSPESATTLPDWITQISPLERIVTVTCSSESEGTDDYRRVTSDGYSWAPTWRNELIC